MNKGLKEGYQNFNDKLFKSYTAQFYEDTFIEI